MLLVVTSFYRVGLLGFVVALAATTTGATAKPVTKIRGSAPPRAADETPIEYHEGKRRLRPTVRKPSCLLFRKCVTLGPTPTHPSGYHEDSWTCRLLMDSEGLRYVDVVGSASANTNGIRTDDGGSKPNGIAAALANATSGSSILTVSRAIIDAEDGEPRMYIPEDAHVRVEDTEAFGTTEDDRHRRKKLTKRKTKGTMNTLVIRVIDKNGIEPVGSTTKTINDVFEDAVSLKTQTEACSYNKLEIQPFKGLTPSNQFIPNGIVDVTMDYDTAIGNTTSSAGMDTAAKKAATEYLGDLDDPMFDLVLFCLPPAKTTVVAYAYGASKYSFYNQGSCSYVPSLMHEVGHNLGLGHSGQKGEDVYGDSTGYMGTSLPRDDWRQCYNPQKSYQLGWYEDQTRSIDPLAEDVLPIEFTLNGVADYTKNKDALVVLRLEQADHDRDYYVGYNRATGINSNTNEDPNHITIVRKEGGAPDEHGESTKVGSLAPGERHIIWDFNGSGNTIQILFAGITDSGDARISIREGLSAPPQPTGACQEFTVEVTTDENPRDYSWFVAEVGGWGRVAGRSPTYYNSHETYTKEVCLPRPTKKTTIYRFSFEDIGGTGMGAGGYRLLDKKTGQQVFAGGGDFGADKTWNHHEIAVAAENKRGRKKKCKDSTRKKFETGSRRSKKKNCRWYARKKKCETEVKTGKFAGTTIEDICKKSCKACR